MTKSLKQLREEAKRCRDCPLWANATQTVFGAGDPHARVMLVGEQPGDEEDRTGLPFVGPAGKLLDRALEAAGIEREHVYITNPVKHFKWQLRGKRRLHKTPAQREIDACRKWLEGEIAAVKPRVIVCLGATAARALLGREFKVSLKRGKFVPSPYAPFALATYHPSALLRLREEKEREPAFRQFVKDLSLVKKALAA
jgi:DNA polymerase